MASRNAPEAPGTAGRGLRLADSGSGGEGLPASNEQCSGTDKEQAPKGVPWGFSETAKKGFGVLSVLQGAPYFSQPFAAIQFLLTLCRTIAVHALEGILHAKHHWREDKQKNGGEHNPDSDLRNEFHLCLFLTIPNSGLSVPSKLPSCSQPESERQRRS